MHRTAVLLAVLMTMALGVRGAGYLANSPPGCDVDAAITCERDFLICKLLNGPADDKDTLCSCAAVFYGDCLRSAGVRMKTIV
jgi:hypothetical protein